MRSATDIWELILFEQPTIKDEYKHWCLDNGHVYDSSESLGEFIREEHREFIKKHTVRYNESTDRGEIHVSCPHCENTESQPVDQQRHHLQSFEIMDSFMGWDGSKLSDVKCIPCSGEFEIKWIYEKPNVTQFVIENTEDVARWFKFLMNNESLIMHPDTPFNDYVDRITGNRVYSDADAETLDALMNKCFEVCEEVGADIYSIAIEVSPSL